MAETLRDEDAAVAAEAAEPLTFANTEDEDAGAD
jgi:hypothetical protein